MGFQCHEKEGHELGTGGTSCALVEKHVAKEAGGSLYVCEGNVSMCRTNLVCDAIYID